MKSLTIERFIQEIKAELEENEKSSSSFAKLEDYKLSNTDCLFSWSAVTGEMKFRKGFKNLLGLDDQILTLDRFVSLIHPEDFEYTKKIGQAAMFESVKRPDGNKDWLLFVSHRIRKTDDSYIRVLAQFIPLAFDSNGRITEFLVRLNDISFANKSDIVEYEFSHPGLDTTLFHKTLYLEEHNIFTEREIEIIELIGQEKKSAEIAGILEISKHTVATHRKNILKKSNCHSVKELIHFCKQNGIF